MCDDGVCDGRASVTPPHEPEKLHRVRDALGLPSIVDVHTHFMPKRVMDKVWAYFDSAGPLTGRPWPITYRLDEQTRVAGLRDFGVSAFTSLVYPHKPDMAAWLNEWATEFARATPDCLHTATFYPEPGAADYVRRAIGAGARVFKAHIQVGDYSPADPLLGEVWDVLEHHRIPTVIHAGSGPAPGRFTGPGPVAEILRSRPALPLIVAHMGMPEYRDFLELAHRYDGVHLDTTMAFTDFSEQMHPFPASARADLLALGDKVLFGSDYPNIPYPYHHAVDAVLRLGLGEQWCRKVLHDNAARLFSLSG
ncbi:putative amidohydrolase [Mycolicibacterium parafortuitum]|uniref:Putative amidohydrolase n=1 Tax=Mycolicibacterium parafortuitum TaxID=39692 RepID=A0A7I7U1T6_MYCPF|nr:amidohydrolase family protein [Mycolicibacterium parafortuitum]PQD97927.1 amidohydrolase [Mycobacterium sp. EPG1]BBY74659.1 putative amidohydrolase [Mycolicibacterium parafortuitum]